MKTPAIPVITEVPTNTPTPIVTATPKPITVESMSQNYGPCAKVSVLMYHHIQDEKIAKEGMGSDSEEEWRRAANSHTPLL